MFKNKFIDYIYFPSSQYNTEWLNNSLFHAGVSVQPVTVGGWYHTILQLTWRDLIMIALSVSTTPLSGFKWQNHDKATLKTD